MSNSEEPTDTSFEFVPTPETSPVSLVIDDRGNPISSTFFPNQQDEAEMASAGGPKMDVPKFGAAHGDNFVWIGGAPLFDWKGTCLKKYATPLAFRGIDPVTEMKGYSKRTSGQDLKFKRDDPDYSLTAFAADALSHMKTHGMDTVFYMTTANEGVPQGSSTGAKEVLNYHTKFTKGEVEAAIEDRLASGVFDTYCVEALADSAAWIHNSIDESLKQSLRSSYRGEASGPVLWMLIVAEVQSDSLRRCVELAADFEKLSLASVRGENIQEYANKAHNILLQLEKDDQLPPTHLLKIVDVLSACSVMDFKVQWMSRRVDVERFVRESNGKAADVVSKMPNKIHFTDLLETAKTSYVNLKHLWGPSTDGKLTQETALLAKLEKMEAMIAKFEGGTKNGDDKTDSWKTRATCHKCNKVGHIQADCPSTGGKPKGDYSEPKDGETTRTIDGKLRKWCSKCRRRGAATNEKGMWTTTHVTADHVNKSAAASESPASANLAEWLGVQSN